MFTKRKTRNRNFQKRSFRVKTWLFLPSSFPSSGKITVKLLGIILCLIFSATIVLGFNPSQQSDYWKIEDYEEHEEKHESVIRTHLVAHSLKEEENQLKEELQEELFKYLQAYRSLNSREETIDQLKKDLPHLEKTLKEELAQLGSDHAVEVELSSREFPLRHYGNRLYPPGEYLSLTVNIGEGKGENWWCLLYPSLCFPLASPKDSEAEEDEGKVKANEDTIPYEEPRTARAATEKDSNDQDHWRYWLTEWWN